MTTFRLRNLVRPLNIAFVLLVALEPVLSAPAYASKVASTSPQPASTYNAAYDPPVERAQPGRVALQADRAGQTALDSIVRLSFQSAYWQVTGLSSQPDLGSEQSSANELSSSARLHVDALDEKGQPLALDGVLTQTLQTEARASTGFTVIQSAGLGGLASTSSAAAGSFTGSGVQATLNLTTHLVNSSGAARQTTKLSMRVLRDGKETTITTSASSESRLVAQNTIRQVVTSSFERDGLRLEGTQTVTVLDLGHGESETWLESSAKEVGSGKVVVSSGQHLFQRVSGGTTSQYVDRFDLTNPYGTYTLKEPGTVEIALGAPPIYNYVLVDEKGIELKLGAGSQGRPPGMSSPLLGERADGGARSDTRALYDLAAPPAQGQGTQDGDERRVARAEHNRKLGDAVVGVASGAAIAILAAAAVQYAFASEGAAAGGAALDATMPSAARAAESAAEATNAINFADGTATGWTAASAAVSTGAVFNADPYFVSSDIRPSRAPANPVPIRITRATGGLVPSVPAPAVAITGTLALTATLQVGDSPLFNDDTMPFVGGTVPAGATNVGAWLWDSANSYQGIPSHTQAGVDGPQLHYFVHAASPLKPGGDTNIIQYVYLDPQQMPKEIYLQFYTGDGDGEHRAYWGEDLVQTGGKRGAPSLYPMGALPKGGGWVRLQVPAARLGLVDTPISGVLYGAYGGQTWWGPTTTSNRLVDNAPDGISMESPLATTTTTHGSSIGFLVSKPAPLTVAIVDGKNKQVRSLLKEAQTAAGYRVLSWDARDDSGAEVTDAPYRVQFSVGGAVVAERGVTITPLVANIGAPGSMSLVRGDQVPVIGEARGDNFSSYILEYGDGLNPTKWQTIVASKAPVSVQPGSSLRSFNPGNLANWNVGVDEYKPYNQPGLNGLYTLRLRVLGKDGREASDSVPVIVGRLAHTPEDGTITSPDGKAKLTIPALSTTRPFAIMALMPLSQLEPDGAWRADLPTGATLLNEVYEVFPADEVFRRPALLELAYDGTQSADKVGVMMGDGTRDGWRFIGGKADPQRKVVSVPVTGFGGKRALVAIFTSSAGFGPAPADPAAGSRLTMSTTLEAPPVVSSTVPFAFYSDLQSSPGEWESLDIAGTRIERVTGPDAGLSPTDAALKVTRGAVGERLLRVRSTRYDADQYPLISFDYRMAPDYAPDLLVRSNGIWWQLTTGTGGSTTSHYFHSLHAAPFTPDGAWHHYQVDLLALLREAQPGATTFEVDGLVMGQTRRVAYEQVAIVDSGEVGSAYYLDNFAALRPTNAASLLFSWDAPSGAASAAATYSFVLDQKADTVPPATAGSASLQATVSVPPAAQDGLWYFHLRAQVTDGTFATTHLPVMLDREPPRLGRSEPAPQGAGPAEQVQIPLIDAGGVDLSSVRLAFGGTVYAWAGAVARGGLRYQPEAGSLLVYRNLLDPAPPEPANGQKVEISVKEMADYAGNKLVAPVSWAFTADRPEASGEEAFKQLTAKGGSSPAISPDGSQVAFVSTRSGVEKVWLMRSDDLEEKAGSAHRLDGGKDTGGIHESAPAWSPDGKTLAFVSDANGSAQVWLAAPDGSGSRALTTGDGGAASPSWLSDGKALAFIRDGNLWEVRADGTDLHALTFYPERPLRSVQSQPDGNLLAVGFKLYQETIEIYDPATGELVPLTGGGSDREPSWLNSTTLLFTAPASPGGLDAIRQVSITDGNSTQIMPGSGEPGSADMQSSVSAGGGSIALVSTRGGERNVWLRPTRQLSSPQVSPSGGLKAGERAQITYTLPATATVTLSVEDSAGKVVRSLLQETLQGPGVQQVAWDGSGADGKALPAGDYLITLAAKMSDGSTLVRRGPLRIVSPADMGKLHLKIEQWAGQPLRPDAFLTVVFYPEGTRNKPGALTFYGGDHMFSVPSGRYDVLVWHNNVRAEARGIVVEGGKETVKDIDLGLGELDVSLLVSAGQPLTGTVTIGVHRTGDPTGASVQNSYSAPASLLLPPGSYDLLVGYDEVWKRVHGGQVRRGQVTRRQVNLELGTVKLAVYTRDEVPADRRRFYVQFVNPKDHAQVIRTAYTARANDPAIDPVELLLPAGVYDVYISYAQSGVSGNVAAWMTGVEVRAGEVTSKEHNLKLTDVTIKVQEAPGKEVDGSRLRFYILPQGEGLYYAVATVETDTVHLELPPGVYEALVTYKGTQLVSAGPTGGLIEVRYGQSVDHRINLALGHIRVQVLDDQGQALAPEGLEARAVLSSDKWIKFAHEEGSNPLDLHVRANTQYDLVLRLKDQRELTIQHKQVKEGEILELKVNARDFR